MTEWLRSEEPFACGYLEAEKDHLSFRVARGMLEHARHRAIDLAPGDFYAGPDNRASLSDEGSCGVFYTFGSGLHVNEDILRRKMAAHPEHAAELEDLLSRLGPLDTVGMIQGRKTPWENSFVKMRVGWGGGTWGGHSNPDYQMLLAEGTDGIRRRIARCRAANAGNDDFYDAQEIALDALEVLGERIRQRALALAETCAEPHRAQLWRIAQAFARIPQMPPRDFFEACQMFWYIFLFDGVDSPGRLDQALIPFYRLSEEDDRRACLDALWQKFYDTRTWNLCISGSDADWKDETNELSYAILETARKFRCNTPNLTMRVHSGTPEKLWQEAAACIATGIGMPALYNDHCVVPALEALGIPSDDAHRYCMNGCNQIDIFGKSHMGLEDGEVCLAKCLELALHNGVCALSGEKLGIETGDPAAFATYEELFDAYRRQVEAAADAVIRMANASQQIYAAHAPNPHRSNLIAGCLEKARDYKNSGPLYGHGQILAEGIADAVDSLAAMKRLVFDRRKYTMAELLAALRADFKGYEKLHRDFCSQPKFGNDDPEVDEIYRQVMEHFYRYLLTGRTFRGGIYGGGCSTFQRAAVYGSCISALPNGKHHGAPDLSDSIGAVPGCDRSGPTALLKSVLSADQTLAKSGNVLNIKFSKALFGTEAMQQRFIQLAKTYFAGGGQQLSVNVVSSQELRDAQLYPEKYASLIVRVGGFSEYFNRLSRELQDNVIARSEY